MYIVNKVLQQTVFDTIWWSWALNAVVHELKCIKSERAWLLIIFSLRIPVLQTSKKKYLPELWAPNDKKINPLIWLICKTLVLSEVLQYFTFFIISSLKILTRKTSYCTFNTLIYNMLFLWTTSQLHPYSANINTQFLPL